MFRISIFQELLKGLPRSHFDKLVRARNADKYCKGFGHWNHLIAMLYAQLSQGSGLRSLVAGFNSHESHHFHLGTQCIRRSTLAGANMHRSDAVFQAAAMWLMGQVSRRLRSQSAQLMYLLDSTSITLKGREFDAWTQSTRTRHTQGIKVHVLLDACTQAPQWQSFSAPNVNDVTLARDVPLRAGACYVFDKGYCDYAWWHSIEQADAYFVTRFKRNAGLLGIEERTVPQEAANVVLADEIVKFRHRHPSGGRVNPYTAPLRCVTIRRPDKASPLVLATNDLSSPALEIARRYKQRWDIELFFKWIKQHLKIRQFLGRSEKAVRIQILTALISYLLLALYKQRHALTGSLWECLAVVCATLFQRQGDESYQRERRRRCQEIANQQLSLI